MYCTLPEDDNDRIGWKRFNPRFSALAIGKWGEVNVISGRWQRVIDIPFYLSDQSEGGGGEFRRHGEVKK